MRQSRLRVVPSGAGRDAAAEIVVHLETAIPALRAACDIAGAADEALEEALLILVNTLRRYRAQAASE
jgi:hypothetical protein